MISDHWKLLDWKTSHLDTSMDRRLTLKRRNYRRPSPVRMYFQYKSIILFKCVPLPWIRGSIEWEDRIQKTALLPLPVRMPDFRGIEAHSQERKGYCHLMVLVHA